MSSPTDAHPNGRAVIADVFVSVIAPLHDDADIAAEFIDEVIGVLSQHYSNYELLLVDDASTDDTVAVVSKKLGEHRCIRLMRLSRSFGQEIAISAGLESTIGDFIVIMLPHSDPPAEVPHMVEAARSGFDVVYGQPSVPPKKTLAARIGGRLFYWYANRVCHLNLPVGASLFRVMSRQAVNAVTQIRARVRHLRVLTAYIGFRSRAHPHQPIKRGRARPGRTLFEGADLAVQTIVTNSIQPLRLAAWISFGVGALNALYLGYVVAIYLFKSNVVAGWTTQSTQSSVMFFFLFLLLAVVSEYVGRILNETIERPMYYVLEERTSSVLLADGDKKNVVGRSVEDAKINKESRLGEPRA